MSPANRSEGITTCPECGDPMYAYEEWQLTDLSLIGTQIGDEGIQGNYAHSRCVDGGLDG